MIDCKKKKITYIISRVLFYARAAVFSSIEKSGESETKIISNWLKNAKKFFRKATGAMLKTLSTISQVSTRSKQS